MEVWLRVEGGVGTLGWLVMGSREGRLGWKRVGKGKHQLRSGGEGAAEEAISQISSVGQRKKGTAWGRRLIGQAYLLPHSP